MSKVIAKDFRATKEIKLPISGVTVVSFSSVLVGDLKDIIAKPEDKADFNIGVIAKVLKSWDLYEKEEDESPLPITVETISRLPAPDFEYLVKELEVFASEQKKS